MVEDGNFRYGIVLIGHREDLDFIRDKLRDIIPSDVTILQESSGSNRLFLKQG